MDMDETNFGGKTIEAEMTNLREFVKLGSLHAG